MYCYVSISLEAIKHLYIILKLQSLKKNFNTPSTASLPFSLAEYLVSTVCEFMWLAHYICKHMQRLFVCLFVSPFHTLKS